VPVDETGSEGTVHLAAGRERHVSLSAAQLSMLLEGIDWRHAERT
jgi:transposase